MPYTVMVADNFHYMDEDERWEYGTFATREEALAACRKLVDEWLALNHKPDMTADALLSQYKSFGDDPYIIAPYEAQGVAYSAWDYACEQAAVLYGKKVIGSSDRR
jgi:hypothetical protein